MTSSAVLAPVRSSSVLIAMVDPWRKQLGVAVRAACFLEPPGDALDQSGGSRAPCRGTGVRCLVEGDDVGERAADVGGQANAGGAAHSGR